MKLDIGIVAFNPEHKLPALLESICNTKFGVDSIEKTEIDITIYIWDNSPDIAVQNEIDKYVNEYNKSNKFFSIVLSRNGENLGFGKGVNKLFEMSQSDWVLTLNQDIEVLTDTLPKIMSAINEQDEQTAAIELRQIPYEHPKNYNPSSLNAPWISGAAFVARRSTFLEVGGFDSDIFMYGEDVDFSWKLRGLGYNLKYYASIPIIHETYTHAGEVKPLQAIEGTLTNLCLRARYGSYADILKGLLQLFAEIIRKQDFKGRRWAMMVVFPRFVKRFLSFRLSGKKYRQSGFNPIFNRWDFSLHRDGAFYEFEPYYKAVEDTNGNLPLVSVIIRTMNRPNVLREAIQSVAFQSYPNVEIIVVEDGPETSQYIIDEFTQLKPNLNINYHVMGQNQGRSKAGNMGLSLAKGEWFNFLDDDDQLYSDHIEVLLREATKHKVKGAYGFAFEVITDIKNTDPYQYDEKMYFTRFRDKFSVLTMLKRNYLPIQSVLFHSDLYEKWGGFEEDMHQLEDWNLWTRYCYQDAFLLVEKTTSKYRVPAKIKEAAARQGDLDDAYASALEKQSKLPNLQIPANKIHASLEEHLNSEMLFGLTREDIRKAGNSNPWLKLLYRSRQNFIILRNKLRAR